jgi:lipopolysaccharide transport protein LptA
MMSPVGYLVAIPFGLILLSVGWVRHQDHSFNTSQRTCAIQVRPRHRETDSKPVTVEQISPALRLDFERYGASDKGGNNLGRDVVFRPVGERPGPARDWLDSPPPPSASHLAHAPPGATRDGAAPGPPSKISDFHDSPPPADPLEAVLPEEAGYNIVADEVTNIELGKQRVVFKGNVRMKSPQFYLTSNQLVIFLGKDKSTMKSAEATGDVNVRLTNVPPEKACRTQSGKAIYDPNKDTLTLCDWPKIKSQSQEQIAANAETKMTIVTRTGKMTTDGKALTRISKAFVSETTSGPAGGVAK